MEAMEQSKSSDGLSSAAQTNGLSHPTALAELSSAQHQTTAASMHQQRSTHPPGNHKQAPCRFYGTKKGCRSGDACPYLHVSPDHGVAHGATDSAQSAVSKSATEPEAAAAVVADAAKRESRPGHRTSQPQAVPRPVSKVQRDSPREFQIGQLRRRFHPKEEQDASGSTTFKFGMAPTDPDFPFDMNELSCSLHVPHDWPSGAARPRLRVTNPDMPRGFQLNVEKGFDGLVESATKDGRSLTLLGLMNSLDRNLERFLIAEKAPTIKLVPNARSAKEPAVPATEPPKQVSSSKKEDVKIQVPQHATPNKRIVPVPQKVYYSPEQRAEAERKRTSETKQLEARLNRLPLYRKLADGLSYIIPITPAKLERLPVNLRAVKTLKLSVPSMYPLEKSSIELQAVDADEARAVEIGFKNWILNSPQTTLMAQVNYVAHNMHVLIQNATADSVPEPQQPKTQSPETITDTVDTTTAEVDGDQVNTVVDTDRPHVKVIPRPPEWSSPNAGETGGSDTSPEHSSDFDDDDFTEEDGEQDGGAPIPETTGSSSATTNAPARGTALNLPGLEMYGIELLEAKSLSITVKCDRCKEYTDIKNIKATNDPSQPAPVKVESCRKCANSFNIAFRREFMHATSQRAGYLDLEGCTAFDLLPSHFQPTCSECSTPFPAPGLAAVRGSSAMTSCRECHRKMNFKISEVKFMVVGISGLSHHRIAAPRRKVRENLGITSGQELPRRGRCKHYGKSYRWFRFSCCAQVFPCDKCHDIATDHPNEHANRMICGFCSNEQNYRPESCGICKHTLVGKAGSGFWEGGKGTRDKVKMSRKDPRKYKRI